MSARCWRVSWRASGGYADRYRCALRRAQAGEFRWVDSIEVDSCHTAWRQLHEDLLATLGLQRGREITT